MRRTLFASKLEPENSGRPLQVDGELLGAADRGCHADHRGARHRERGAGTVLRELDDLRSVSEVADRLCASVALGGKVVDDSEVAR